MSTYVDELEDLINLNPITRRKLVEEATQNISMVDKSTDEATQTAFREVILRKLE